MTTTQVNVRIEDALLQEVAQFTNNRSQAIQEALGLWVRQQRRAQLIEEYRQHYRVTRDEAQTWDVEEEILDDYAV